MDVIIEDNSSAERAETNRLITMLRGTKQHGAVNHFILLTERLKFARAEVARLESIIDVRDYEDAYGEDA